MADIVTQMLRFGKSQLVNGFTQQELINHLTKNGFQIAQVTNIISLYFQKYFAYQGGGVQTPQTRYYLQPNGYFDLLQIENTLESRRQSQNANCIATISIIISGILALAAILTTIFYTSNVKLNDNNQLKELINNTSQNNNILQQSQEDIRAIRDTLNSRINNNEPIKNPKK